MPRAVKVCRVTDLSPEEKIALTISGESILVVNYEGAFYAVSNICTHEHVELVSGFLIDDSIVCPAHLSRFRLKTGDVLNPPALLPLKTYRTVVEDGEVFLEV
jgi:nitrite reductase/ring-hydroxylating ferredoxin subunit